MIELSTNNKEVILASSSLTRINILRKYNINVKIIKHKVDENIEKEKKKTFKNIVCNLAKNKAFSIADDFPYALIIGSDQILVHNKKILSKAKNKEDAINNLMLLQDSAHTLLSAICVINDKKPFWSIIKKAEIYMKKLKLDEVKKYVTSNPNIALSTVGGYMIESDFLNCLKIIEGDLETIKGFPIQQFIPKLRGIIK